jgi:hypothetical protein
MFRQVALLRGAVVVRMIRVGTECLRGPATPYGRAN